MTTPAVTVLSDAFGRVRDGVHECLEGAAQQDLVFRPNPDANSPAWLIWHLTRVQDDHVAGAFDQKQIWTQHGWVQQFALPFEESDTGYGHSSSDVAAVDVSAELLRGYHDAVHAATLGYLNTVEDGDLDRVVDRNWTPPVTLGVRLVSVLEDDLQHLGQAAYVLGLAAHPST